MNPFRTSHKTQAIRAQYPYFPNLTCGVCLQNTSDYSPFGVSLDGRTMQGDFYRYSFQGYEADYETKGDGNSNTTEYRQYDQRLGRWLSVDPVNKEFESTYASFANSPIWIIDIDGADTGRVFIFEKKWKNVYKTHVMGVAKNPNIIGANGKIYITYDPNRSNARKRRTAAKGKNVSIPQQNLDEFPYASTKEGGINAAVNYVPEKENKEHGGYIGAVVVKNKMIEGDVFEITLIPETKKKTPKKQPALVTIPKPMPVLKIQPVIGYPGQGFGELISDGLKWLFDVDVSIPDPLPIISPIPSFNPISPN